MFRVRTAIATHAGQVRAVNEDAVLADPVRGLWVVADGMGGHDRGDWASSTVVAAIRPVALDGDLAANCQALADALGQANATIFAAGESNGETIGSTVVLLHLLGEDFACLWAGDSRVYQLSRGALHQVSRDHSQVDELVAEGLLTADEARDHPLGHVITRAVGVRPDIEIDVVTGRVHDNDRFLVCSDGLIRCMADAEIAAMLGEGGPESVVERMIEICLARGAPDNVSVAAVACEQTTLVEALQR